MRGSTSCGTGWRRAKLAIVIGVALCVAAALVACGGGFRAIHGVKRRFAGVVVSSIFLCDYIVGVFIGGLARLGCAADP